MRRVLGSPWYMVVWSWYPESKAWQCGFSQCVSCRLLSVNKRPWISCGCPASKRHFQLKQQELLISFAHGPSSLLLLKMAINPPKGVWKKKTFPGFASIRFSTKTEKVIGSPRYQFYFWVLLLFLLGCLTRAQITHLSALSSWAHQDGRALHISQADGEKGTGKQYKCLEQIISTADIFQEHYCRWWDILTAQPKRGWASFTIQRISMCMQTWKGLMFFVCARALTSCEPPCLCRVTHSAPPAVQGGKSPSARVVPQLCWPGAAGPGHTTNV